MTVGRINITVLIEHKSERIHLAKRKLLHAASIHLETEGVSRDQSDRITIGAGEGRPVGETMTRMDPAIVATDKIAHHAVCVLISEGTEHHFPALELVVAIGIGELVN